jgi:hypothetical protein
LNGASTLAVVKRVAIAVSLVAFLCGCTYDYLQRSDRVAYSAGDAVKANLERETTDPSKGSMYVTSGLGKNGSVMPDGAEAAAPAE